MNKNNFGKVTKKQGSLFFPVALATGKSLFATLRLPLLRPAVIGLAAEPLPSAPAPSLKIRKVKETSPSPFY